MRRPVAVLGRTAALYNEDGCGTHAAAIAYYAIFSLVPLSLLILSVLGLVIDEQRIVTFVFDQVPIQESQFENVRQVVDKAHEISLAGISFGALLLIWSGSGIFAAVRRGLNAAEHRRQARPYWRGKVIDLTLIPLFGLLIMLSIGLTATTQIVIERAGAFGSVDFNTNVPLRVASFAVPAMITFTMFCLLYRYVPSGRTPWRDALAGATFASLLFEAAKNLGAYAFGQLAFTRDTAIYAGFGTALAFLFWMFVNASILLLGAEFARALSPALEAEAAAREAAATRSGAMKPQRTLKPTDVA